MLSNYGTHEYGDVAKFSFTYMPWYPFNEFTQISDGSVWISLIFGYIPDIRGFHVVLSDVHTKPEA